MGLCYEATEDKACHKLSQNLFYNVTAGNQNGNYIIR